MEKLTPPTSRIGRANGGWLSSAGAFPDMRQVWHSAPPAAKGLLADRTDETLLHGGNPILSLQFGSLTQLCPPKVQETLRAPTSQEYDLLERLNSSLYSGSEELAAQHRSDQATDLEVDSWNK